MHQSQHVDYTVVNHSRNIINLNLNNISNNKGESGGPPCKQLLSEVPVFPSFDEASYTILIFVVSVFSLIKSDLKRNDQGFCHTSDI